MLYRVPGDPKTGYDSGRRCGDVRWVRTVGTYTGTGTIRVRCGYGTGTVRGYSTAFSENRYGGYTVPVRRTYGPYPRTVPVPYPYRTRTQKHVPTYRTHTHKHVPTYCIVPTYRTVPNPPRYVHCTPPRDAQIENLIS